MQMGYNNDISYRDRVVHIQTEDHGLGSAKITSQVFVAGAILDSRTISYADEVADLPDDERDARIRRLMQKLHKSFQRRILGGHYDDRLFPGEEKKSPKTDKPAAPTSTGTTGATPSAGPPKRGTATATSAADAPRLRGPDTSRAWQGCTDPERMRIFELLEAG